MMVFHQICEINELDPQTIIQEAHQNCPDRFSNGNDVDALIRTAYEHRANDLLKGANVDLTKQSNANAGGKPYRIDADPAGPAFTVNEEYIRRAYSKEAAASIIEALGHVKMPVTG